jgi:hypothetical protein
MAKRLGWLRDLNAGDLIRNTGSGNVYVVVLASDGKSDPVVALHITASNPTEWVKVAADTGRVSGGFE